MKSKIMTHILEVDDLRSQAEQFLTRKAKIALEKEAVTTIVKDALTKELFMCTYFGVVVKQSEIDDGIKLIAGRINELASKNLIHSCLSHFVKMDLSPETSGYFNKDGSLKELECVVLCYVLVPEETFHSLQKDKILQFEDAITLKEEPKYEPVVPKLVEATRANLNGDPLESITYTLAKVRNAFPGQIFEFGKKYEFTYENGHKVLFKRNTDRFYSGKLGEGYEDMEFVPKGVTSAGVFHKIVSIRLAE